MLGTIQLKTERLVLRKHLPEDAAILFSIARPFWGHGYAGELIQRAIDDAKAQGRSGIVLTCKDKLVDYYAKFGFANEGKSNKCSLALPLEY